MKKYKKLKIKKLSFFSKVINENCCIVYIFILGIYESYCMIVEIFLKLLVIIMWVMFVESVGIDLVIGI